MNPLRTRVSTSNVLAYSDVDPLKRHNAAALAWLEAVQEALVKTPRSPEFVDCLQVLRNETEVPSVGDNNPVRIYLNFIGKGAELYDFEGYFSATLPGSRFVRTTVMRHDFTLHRRIPVPCMWIEVDPNEPTPKERRFSVHRDLGLPLTNGEFLWLIVSIFGLAFMIVVLWRHWAGYHEPWKGVFDLLFDLPRRLFPLSIFRA